MTDPTPIIPFTPLEETPSQNAGCGLAAVTAALGAVAGLVFLAWRTGSSCWPVALFLAAIALLVQMGTVVAVRSAWVAARDRRLLPDVRVSAAPSPLRTGEVFHIGWAFDAGCESIKHHSFKLVCFRTLSDSQRSEESRTVFDLELFNSKDGNGAATGEISGRLPDDAPPTSLTDGERVEWRLIETAEVEGGSQSVTRLYVVRVER